MPSPAPSSRDQMDSPSDPTTRLLLRQAIDRLEQVLELLLMVLQRMPQPDPNDQLPPADDE